MTDLFEDNNDPIDVDPDKYFEENVGEGKRYKTPQEFYKSKFHGEAHITNLERENEELRADAKRFRDESIAQAKLSELIEQLDARRTQNTDTNPDQNNATTPAKLDPKEIESLIDARMTERERSRRENDNLSQVKAKLTERFGNNYKNALERKVLDLGLDEQFVDNLAKTNPRVFYKTFDLDRAEPTEEFDTPLRSSRRGDFSPQVQKRTWSFYEKMRTEQPDLYREQRIQDQMFEDAKTLGDDFKDGSFNRLTNLR